MRYRRGVEYRMLTHGVDLGRHLVAIEDMISTIAVAETASDASAYAAALLKELGKMTRTVSQMRYAIEKYDQEQNDGQAT